MKEKVSLNLPTRYSEAIRSLVDAGECNTHSQAIEEALRDFLPHVEIISKTLGSEKIKTFCVTLDKQLVERIITLTCSPKKIYPSKSELIRHAIHCFLVKKLKLDSPPLPESRDKCEKELEEPFDEKNYVRIPIEQVSENGELIHSFKIHKIIKRLA